MTVPGALCDRPDSPAHRAASPCTGCNLTSVRLCKVDITIAGREAVSALLFMMRGHQLVLNAPFGKG